MMCVCAIQNHNTNVYLVSFFGRGCRGPSIKSVKGYGGASTAMTRRITGSEVIDVSSAIRLYDVSPEECRTLFKTSRKLIAIHFE